MSGLHPFVYSCPPVCELDPLLLHCPPACELDSPCCSQRIELTPSRPRKPSSSSTNRPPAIEETLAELVTTNFIWVPTAASSRFSHLPTWHAVKVIELCSSVSRYCKPRHRRYPRLYKHLGSNSLDSSTVCEELDAL